MTATPIATQYTYEFVRRHLPERAARVPEIGCGRGDLAARLGADGLEVTAIDSDSDLIAVAQALGVNAQVQSWPARMEQRFDGVLNSPAGVAFRQRLG